MPARVASGFDLVPLAMLVLILTVAMFPILLRRPQPPDGGADEDSPGGGPGEDPPPWSSPGSPRGGIPLTDAQQSASRLRGHERAFERRAARQRRDAREPERTPERI